MRGGATEKAPTLLGGGVRAMPRWSSSASSTPTHENAPLVRPREAAATAREAPIVISPAKTTNGESETMYAARGEVAVEVAAGE